MIVILFVFFFLYCIGFIAGVYYSKIERSSKLEEIKEKISKKDTEDSKPSIPTGVIKPPSDQFIYEKSLPQKRREGIQAMREALDNSPLGELKKKLEEYNKSIKK